MRATPTITWLLLSLSFLLPSVCSDDVNESTTPVSKNDSSVTSAPTAGSPAGDQPTVSSKPNTADTNVALTNVGKENESSPPPPPLPPPPANPTAAITASAAKVTTAPKITSGTTQPQPPKVTDNPAALPTANSGAVSTVTNSVTQAAAAAAASTAAAAAGGGAAAAAAVTPGPATAGDQGATPSSNSSTVSTNAATAQTPKATLPIITAGTRAPTGPSGNTVKVETTKTPQAPTDALTNGKQPTAHTTITSKTTPQDGKDSIVGVPTASGAPSPSGNTGTTLTTPTLTRTGPPAAGTLSTRAASTSMSATHSAHTTATTTATPKTFQFSLNKGLENEEEKELAELCKRLMEHLKDGNCTLTLRHHKGKIQFEDVEINGKVDAKLATQYYEELNKKPTDNKTLIAILASCGALLIMIVILAVCASHHRKPYNENQQHLTEELHTVENGYHDNPTLEVMEVQPEMQEKKMALNGEFNDSWIVPIDNLLKEDIPDEEDTHL